MDYLLLFFFCSVLILVWGNELSFTVILFFQKESLQSIFVFRLKGGGMGSGLGPSMAPLPTGMSLMQRPSSSSDHHLSPSGHLTPTGM